MGIFNLYKSVNRLDSTLFNIQKGDLLNPPRITVPALTLIKASFNGVQYLMMFLEPHLLLPASPKSPAHA
eukprot:jgi/Mesen1/2278/ME000154S01451